MDDPWIAANSPIEAEKLHAMGVITFHWNVCEFYLRSLLAFAAHRPFDSVWTETSSQRPRNIYAKIRRAVADSRDAEATKEAILYAIALYDRNRENRAQITHFLPEGGVSSALHNNKNPDFLAIFDQTPIRSDIDALRRVAEDIRTCRTYLAGLINALSRTPLDAMIGKAGPMPDKPPLPTLLWTP
jgi:hypothetical protein